MQWFLNFNLFYLVALNYGLFRQASFNATPFYVMFYDMGSTSTIATIAGVCVCVCALSSFSSLFFLFPLCLCFSVSVCVCLSVLTSLSF